MSTERTSDHRTSDHRAPAPATRTARTLRVASRRRLGVRVAMVGTVAGLMTSVAAPAMAATGHGTVEAARPVVVTASAPAPQPHATAVPKTPAPEGVWLDAFYDAGYGYADAEVLAGHWDLASPFDAKLAGGAKVKAGSKLPFPPKTVPKTPKVSPVEERQVDAFYDAGYGYADAEVLAGYWDLASPFDAKLAGGAKVKAGLKLPFPPKAVPKAAQHR